MSQWWTNAASGGNGVKPYRPRQREAARLEPAAAAKAEKDF
jgi:hypothetical protein